MSIDNDHTLREVPEHWLAIIVHYVTGFHNITGKEFSEPIIKPALAKIYPIFIIQYGILSLLGIIANVYVVYYIMRYKLYRDVTHAFIMNLGLAHFVQCGIVLPMTLMVIIIQNWIFGQFLCFFLPLLQDIPLHVTIISHLLIAWDRMRWLGDPLKARLPSFVCSCATWLTGMVIALPYPIYTTYLDLGLYLPKFRGVGICVVNLVDDMQEYMRGLFVIMYCAPATILAYLYIRTARELRPPEGPLSVMMFEHRADVRNRQRSSTNNNSGGHQATTISRACSRSYDLYDAEVDVTREKRTQRHLGAMAATQIICICPLMILRIARMVLVETYENTSHFDITYLLFIWIAFLPTVINPCIYASWVLSRIAKERLRGYFRLSSKSSDKKLGSQRSNDNSVTQDNTTETFDESKTLKTESIKEDKPKQQPKINAITDLKQATKNKTINNFSSNLKSRLAVAGFLDSSGTVDALGNSCSNITASTYCNGVDGDNGYFDKHLASDRESLVSGTTNRKQSRDFLSDIDVMSRRESSSTFERDMEIIDLLERERSMDIQDMIERERRSGDPARRPISRHNSSFERHHRKLPDISKLVASPNSPKKLDQHFPNLVFTHQNDMAATYQRQNSRSGSYASGHGSSVGGINAMQSTRESISSTRDSLPSTRDSFISTRDERNFGFNEIRSANTTTVLANRERVSRTRSTTSSTKSASSSGRERRLPNGEYKDTDRIYAQKL